jgi:hypothetical protein
MKQVYFYRCYSKKLTPYLGIKYKELGNPSSSAKNKARGTEIIKE